MANIRETRKSLGEYKIYVGKQEVVDGDTIPELRLTDEIRSFQKSQKKLIPVRITNTMYVAGDYDEKGWEIGIIDFKDIGVRDFAMGLAKHLLVALKQTKVGVTVCWEGESLLIEDIDAKQCCQSAEECELDGIEGIAKLAGGEE